MIKKKKSMEIKHAFVKIFEKREMKPTKLKLSFCRGYYPASAPA
jgi:hypothetical protein